MKKIHKKLFACILVVLLFVNAMGVMAQEYGEIEVLTPENLQEKEAFEASLASQPPTIQPFYVLANDISVNLSIKSGVATCSYSITGYPSVTQISNYVYLQKLNSSTLYWEGVTDWSKRHYASYASSSFTHNLSKTGHYRVKLITYIYKGNVASESATEYSSTKTY